MSRMDLHVHVLEDSFDATNQKMTVLKYAADNNIKAVAFTGHDSNRISDELADILKTNRNSPKPMVFTHNGKSVKVHRGIEVSVFDDKILTKGGTEPYEFHVTAIGGAHGDTYLGRLLQIISMDNAHLRMCNTVSYILHQATLKGGKTKEEALALVRKIFTDRSLGLGEIELLMRDFRNSHNIPSFSSHKRAHKESFNGLRFDKMKVRLSDLITLAHSKPYKNSTNKNGGALVFVAHYGLTEKFIQDPRLFVERVLDLGIDGFEKQFNNATKEHIDFITGIIKQKGMQDKVYWSAGSDNHDRPDRLAKIQTASGFRDINAKDYEKTLQVLETGRQTEYVEEAEDILSQYFKQFYKLKGQRAEELMTVMTTKFPELGDISTDINMLLATIDLHNNYHVM